MLPALPKGSLQHRPRPVSPFPACLPVRSASRAQESTLSPTLPALTRPALPACGVCVQRRGGLVQQQHQRLECNGNRERHALRLAALHSAAQRGAAPRAAHVSRRGRRVSGGTTAAKPFNPRCMHATRCPCPHAIPQEGPAVHGSGQPCHAAQPLHNTSCMQAGSAPSAAGPLHPFSPTVPPRAGSAQPAPDPAGGPRQAGRLAGGRAAGRGEGG